MDLPSIVESRLRFWVTPGTRLLCAISGGPDSVVLAHLLRSMPFRFVLGHVDHQMRKDSSRDARFIEGLAKRWVLPLKVARVPVMSYAASKHIGLEEAARELRYEALIRMARRTRCSAIVTAHTADDQAETILLNFLRGSGASGLAGIPPRRVLAPGLTVLRPLLGVSRQELLSYLRRNHLPFRTDSTNRQMRFTRNRIRHQMIPLLEKDFPGLKRRLGQLGDILREEEGFWETLVKGEFDKTVRQNHQKITVDLVRLLGYHKALGRRILRHLLSKIPFQDVEQIWGLAESPRKEAALELRGGLCVFRKGEQLVLKYRTTHDE